MFGFGDDVKGFNDSKFAFVEFVIGKESFVCACVNGADVGWVVDEIGGKGEDIVDKLGVGVVI